MTVLVSIRDAARVTRVPAGTIRRWVAEGRLTRHGARKPFKVDLDEFDIPVARRLKYLTK